LYILFPPVHQCPELVAPFGLLLRPATPAGPFRCFRNTTSDPSQLTAILKNEEYSTTAG